MTIGVFRLGRPQIAVPQRLADVVGADRGASFEVGDCARDLQQAVAGAGGEIACLGAPVEPGNLVMLAYFGEAPLLNVPGCIRSPHPSMVNRILAALLAGERLSRAEIIRMGHGGLMEGTEHGL